MSLQAIDNKRNTVAVIVREGGGIEILSNGTVIHPAGGPDNNPFGRFINQLAEPLAQTEHIEDPAMKAALRSAIAGQIIHAVSRNLPSPNHPVLTCGQMEAKIIELQAMAAKATSRGQRDFFGKLVASDEAILNTMCSHGGGRIPF